MQWILKKLGIIGKFLAILFKEGLRQELEMVLPIAAEVVTKIENDPTIVLNKGKLETAVVLITAELISKQVKVAVSTIHLAIELAVKNMET